MKLFLDTNIVMDYMANREPFITDALNLFQMGYEGIHQLHVSDLTFANIAYLSRKVMPRDQLYEMLEALCMFLHVGGINKESVMKAIRLRAKDFEDALQYYAAKEAGADCIITRNKKDFYFSDIPVYTPEEFLYK